MRKEYGEAIVLMKKRIKCSFAPVATGLLGHGVSRQMGGGVDKKKFSVIIRLNQSN